MEDSTATLAPIALFAFKRPEHLRRTINALKQNPEFPNSPVHVFCDGARRPDELPMVQRTREVARALLPTHTVFVERTQNLGLQRSIVEGVSEITAAYGKVIVIEDDLVVAQGFLRYMNEALRRYEREPQVMQVSGHMFPVSLRSTSDAFFLPFTTTWGWGTWSRAWQKFEVSDEGFERLTRERSLRRAFDLNGAYPFYRMLKEKRIGKVDSWGIYWYLTVFLNEGLVVFPRESFVLNIGFDGTGTNTSAYGVEADYAKLGSNCSIDMWPDTVAVDRRVFDTVILYLRSSNGMLARLYTGILRFKRRLVSVAATGRTR